MLVDSHCHLNEFSSPKKVVETALSSGVSEIVSCSEELNSMNQNLDLAKQFPQVRACFGIHPSQAKQTSKDDLDKAIDFVKENIDFCYAIGEVGLDFSFTQSEEEKKWQETIFFAFIDLALYFDKAIVVHSRAAEKRVMEILLEKDVGKVLLHWFFADDELLEKAIVAKFFVSVGPSVFSQKKFQDFVKKVPKNLLLLETDAPVKFDGKTAEPSWIPLVLKRVSELTQISETDLRVEFERNIQILFL